MSPEKQAPGQNSLQSFTDRILDFAVTLACWTWLSSFSLFLSWAYLAVALFTKKPEAPFQRLNYHFFRIFFRVVRFTAPGKK